MAAASPLSETACPWEIFAEHQCATAAHVKALSAGSIGLWSYQTGMRSLCVDGVLLLHRHSIACALLVAATIGSSEAWHLC